MTHVYIIQAEGGPVKVGHTTDPVRRLNSLQTGASAKLSLAHIEKFDSADHARRAERYIHEELCEYKTLGEWFQVDATAAVELARAAAHLLRQDGGMIGARKASARTGQVVISAYFDRAVRQQLAILAIKQERSQAALMADALNLLFERYGEAPIARA